MSRFCWLSRIFTRPTPAPTVLRVELNVRFPRRLVPELDFQFFFRRRFHPHGKRGSGDSCSARASFIPSGRIHQAAAFAECHSAIQPIANRRYARRRSADWQSAVSPVANRQSRPLSHSASFIPLRRSHQAGAFAECHSAIQPIANRRYARRRSADWQSAVSPVANRQSRLLSHSASFIPLRRSIQAGACGECHSAIQPIANRRYARRRSADWQSAVSPVANRQSR
ncbi:MAG: hypothetical protein QOF48_717, partial [Verrucomicrobiota bacterium]